MNESNQRRGLATTDVFGILVCWLGAIGVSWSGKNEPIVPLGAVVAAYFLSKWIITRED
ncbi:MAG: hypothetical protein NE327_15195 [Lentisphaeraceae bacterium]|nr:hypothetical protein [Lentisphaeraceae bacterium]